MSQSYSRPNPRSQLSVRSLCCGATRRTVRS